MGDIIWLDAYRGGPGRLAPAGVVGPRDGVPVAPINLGEACLGLTSGVGRMRAAARLLAEATSELRDLARAQARDPAG